MNKRETNLDPLVYRAVSVILTCRTLEQLNVAISYSNLVYREMSKTIGRINSSKFRMYVERAIGFAQCNIINTGPK